MDTSDREAFALSQGTLIRPRAQEETRGGRQVGGASNSFSRLFSLWAFNIYLKPSDVNNTVLTGIQIQKHFQTFMET